HPRCLPSFPTRRSSDLDWFAPGDRGTARYSTNRRGPVASSFAREILRQSAGPRLLPSFAAAEESHHDFRKWPALAYRSMKDFSRSEEHTSELQSRFDLV